MDESKVVELARKAGYEKTYLSTQPHGRSLKFLTDYTELINKEKAKEIAELYQMCLNQAMTIKKYIDKYGDLE